MDLWSSITEEEKTKIINVLRDMAYMHTQKTIEELMQAYEREHWKSEYGKVEQKALSVYKAKVMMAMYYVQIFGISKGGKSYNSSERRIEKLMPTLEEVEQKLQLSENEIICLACLYYFYFIPMAEKDCNTNIEEWLSKRERTVQNFATEYEEECFEISRVKDLAKLYMVLRFKKRMKISSKPWHREDEYKEQFWRDILALESMSHRKEVIRHW